MGRVRSATRYVGAVLLCAGLGLSACSSEEAGPGADAASSPSASADPTDPATTESEPADLPTATPPPSPPERACYRLDFAAALAPTAQGRSVDCAKKHTSITVGVGALDNLVDGHLLAVDSRRVRDAVAEDCPRIFADFVGGSARDQRLSMLRPVWFTPTLDESDEGAQWFRCDAIAVAGDERLADLTGRLAGVLDRPEGRDRYGMCGTAAPDDADFERVVCSARHTWRAIGTVDFEPGDYPGVDVARERGQAPCEDAGADAAADPLDYEWAYEWPTAAQWKQGQTFGRCWAPD